MRLVHATSACTILLLALGCASAPPRTEGAPRLRGVEELVIADSGEAKPLVRRAPRYPADMKAANVQASFVTLFVVDTSGGVEMETVAFQQAPRMPFREAVCTYLAGEQFMPVVRDGVKRRALAVAPWTFALSDGPVPPPSRDLATPLRREIQREGLASAAARVERGPHCPNVAAPTATLTPRVAVLALTPPARVGQFTRGERHDFGTPDVGVSYSYSAGGVRLAAFFYERGRQSRALGDEQALETQAAAFRVALDVERRRGLYDAFDITADRLDTLAVDGVAYPGRAITLGIRRQGEAYRSTMHAHAVGNGYIKVRATAPVAQWEALDIDGFVHALVRSAIGGQ